VVPESIRQDPEEWGEDELGDVEHRVEDRERRRGDDLAAMLGQFRQVDGQHGAGETGAEAQREGAGQHGPHRSIHARQAYRNDWTRPV